jgi:hypothetical protein
MKVAGGSFVPDGTQASDLTAHPRARIMRTWYLADSSRGLGYRPLKAETRVRIPYPLHRVSCPGMLFRGNFCYQPTPSMCHVRSFGHERKRKVP